MAMRTSSEYSGALEAMRPVGVKHWPKHRLLPPAAGSSRLQQSGMALDVEDKASTSSPEAAPLARNRSDSVPDLGEYDGRMDAAGEPPDDHLRPAFSEAWSRGRWLLGLLVLQSGSSIVLDQYQDLLRDHLVVTLFLTMLVGAGGNAGNQSAIKVIRALATGQTKVSRQCIVSTLWQQSKVGLLLGAGLSVGGYVRVWISTNDPAAASAISLSLLLIVMSSVIIGTSLPFGLARLGMDPCNAGTSIQVVMDILGVAITCGTCTFILDQLATSLPAA